MGPTTGEVRVNKASAHSMFSFAMGYGGLRMALRGNEIPFDAVVPIKWQRAMGIAARKKGETQVSHKNRIKARAQQLFPTIKVTLATCDALLLAEYCRRQHIRSE